MSLGDFVLGVLKIGFGVAAVRSGASLLAGTSGGGLARAPLPVRKPRGGVRPASPTVAGPMRLTTHNVRSLKDRVAHIQRLARKGKTDPKIYAWTRKVLTKKCGKDWCVAEKDTLAEIKALYDAQRGRVRYTSDPRGVDTYVNPRHTLAMMAADCDDYAAFACASLESVGIKCKLKVIRTKDSPEPNHIYALAAPNKQRPSKFIGFDTSVAKFAGWEPPASMVAESWLYDI